MAVGAPATTRAHVERVWALLREGHDWLAADFAAAAAERAARATDGPSARAGERGARERAERLDGSGRAAVASSPREPPRSRAAEASGRSALERPDEALLGDRGDVRAVGGPDLAEAQRPAAGGRRAVGLVEEPLVGADRPVEPHRVVEARADEAAAPAAAEPGEPGRQQGQVADEGQRRRRARRVVGQPPATRIQPRTRCPAGGFGGAVERVVE